MVKEITAQAATIFATVREVYASFGVAYVADVDEHTWGVTRSTPGAAFDALQPGRHVRLAVRDFENSSIVTEYGLID